MEVELVGLVVGCSAVGEHHRTPVRLLALKAQPLDSDIPEWTMYAEEVLSDATAAVEGSLHSHRSELRVLVPHIQCIPIGASRSVPSGSECG